MALKGMLDLLQQAVEIDPNFALGHAWMAFTYRDMASVGSMAQAEAFDKARESAQKALSLDESLAEAHAALGLIACEHDWDFATAEKEYRRATELAPGLSAGSILNYLVCTGRFDEALAIAKREAESNPLEPWTAAWILYQARRFDEAIVDANKFIELHPNNFGIRAIRSSCYALKKMCAEALAESEKILSGFASAALDPNILIGLACNYACCGDRKKAEELTDALKKTGYLDQDPAGLAVIYAQLGDKDLAITALKKGFESHSAGMPIWKGDPWLDPLRDDPSFKALLKKYGFEK
jgi:Tfp pilus assembly protein PilF